MLPELLSPAGSFDAALAAFQYGADAVYLGLPRFSARADADNLTPERVQTLLAYAHSFSPAKKIYVTFNTLVQDTELPQALDTLETLEDLAPNGVIVQDLGVARLIRDHFPRLALHASTQLAAHNLEGVLALKALGFSRVVLARELTLAEIGHIVSACGIEVELFVHGALCYSLSGLCLFSSHTAGRSGNRGRCAYCCREPFADSAGRRSYPFSMKDLALAPCLDAVAATHAHSLKIEGRMKSPLYVACVTDYYRRKLDGRLSPEDDFALTQDLQTVFSRPWTRLYAEGPNAEAVSIIDPVAVGHRGAPIGRAEAVTLDRDGVRWLRFTSNRALEKHDGLQIELPDGGKPFGCAVTLLRAAGTQRPLIALPAGSAVEVALPSEDVPMIPCGAPLFCSASQAVRRRYEIRSLRESALTAGHPVNVEVTLAPDGVAVRASAARSEQDKVAVNVFVPLALTPSRQPGQTRPAVRKAFERLGDTAWQLGTLTLADPLALYAPPSKLNEARRAVLEKLTSAWSKRRAERLADLLAVWTPGPAVPTSGRTPRPASWSLKLRAEAPLPHAADLEGIGTVVLALGHTPCATLEKRLSDWRTLADGRRIRLALPLITRAPEMPRLKATLRALVQSGWAEWECADLAGCRLLDELGLKPASADWSLYAINRVAACELTRLGMTTQVLSPEITLETLRELFAASSRLPMPEPELIVYQHTPLFISQTAPCLPNLAPPATAQAAACPPEARPDVTLTDRRKRSFITRFSDQLWSTVWNTPYCLAEHLPEAREAGIFRFRIDLSWSPSPENVYSVIQPVKNGKPQAGTHAANFETGLP